MESGEGKGGVEEDDKNPQQGGGRDAGVRIFLQSCHSVGAALWRGDMGSYPPNGLVPGWFPGLGVAAIDRPAPATAGGREVGVHLDGGGKG